MEDITKAPFCMVYLVGNSHLAKHRGIGQNLHSFLHPNLFIENLAAGGAKVEGFFQRSLDTIERRESDYPTLNESYVIVMIGDNDLRKGIPKEILIDKLMSVMDECIQRNPNLILFFCGILKSPSLKLKIVRDFNFWMSNRCERYTCNGRRPLKFIDLRKMIAKVRDIDYVPESDLLFLSDGVHLNPSGERLLCRIFASVVNPMVHKQFNNSVYKILDTVKLRTQEPEFLDYIRMKGIFRKGYLDIIDFSVEIRPLLEKDLKEEIEEKEETKIGGVFTNPFCGYREVELLKEGQPQYKKGIAGYLVKVTQKVEEQTEQTIPQSSEVD